MDMHKKVHQQYSATASSKISANAGPAFLVNQCLCFYNSNFTSLVHGSWWQPPHCWHERLLQPCQRPDLPLKPDSSALNTGYFVEQCLYYTLSVHGTH